jgi:molybdopterin synthase catalytic subunit
MVKTERVGLKRKGEVSLQDLLELAHSHPDINYGGAIATFTGIVRGYTHLGKEVEKLEFEADEETAEKALSRISEELRARPGIVDVLIHHMVGTFLVGEDIVFVVVVGRSRQAVFQVLEEAVERYKKELPIWKKEHLTNGASYWV